MEYTSPVSQYIDHIVYINLDKRVDRREHIEGELSKMGLSGERFSAISHIRGEVGCFLSHLTVLKHARERKYRNILILEDDFEFLVERPEFEGIVTTFFKQNVPYDVLLLAYACRKSEPYNDIVMKGRDLQTTSGYIVHEQFYDRLIKLSEESLEKLIETNDKLHYSLDMCWKVLQPVSDWFVFRTRIGRQRKDYSDIEGMVVEYNC